MHPDERHRDIAALVQQQGRVLVSELALAQGVTPETVRRDLAQLERSGVVRRVHGGAVAAHALTVVEPGLADRDTTRAEQKDRIARAALALLPRAGGSLLLDAGTTTGRLAGLLPADRRFVVVTHCVPVAARVCGTPGLTLHLVGGQVRGTTQAAVGPEALRTLDGLRADVAFVGTNALSVGHGLSTPNVDEAAVKRALVAAGRQVVVLADSSKVGREDLVRFASLVDVDVVVTDDGLADDDARALDAAGVEVVVA